MTHIRTAQCVSGGSLALADNSFVVQRASKFSSQYQRLNVGRLLKTFC